MKILKPLFLALAASCAGLLCQNDDLTKLTQILKELAEPGTTGEQPFATHCLVIVTECIEHNEAMPNVIESAFKGQLPLLVTEPALKIYTKMHKKNTLPDSYRYFQPNKKFDPYFLLCVPAHMIEGTLTPHADGTPVSQLEKSCGLRIEHFTELKNLTPEKLETTCLRLAKWLGAELLTALQTIFVPNSAYGRTELPPRWILAFNGHGKQYEAYDDNEILQNHKLIKKPGEICGIDAENFEKITSELHQKITVVVLNIYTCFGGGINVGNLKSYPFIITTGTITGDSCIAAREIYEYDKFFDLFRSIKAKAPNTNEVCANALAHITPETDHIAAMKPAIANYFIDAPRPNMPNIRIDASTLKAQTKDINPKGDARVVLYVNNAPLTIHSAAPHTEIYSGIPGSTYHIIAKLTHASSPLVMSLHFCELRKKSSGTIKLFHIKEWITEYNEDYEVRIMKYDDYFDALVTYGSQQNKPPATLLHEEAESNLGTKITDFTAEEANAWIKKFDEKIIFLKKLANAQAPYRFLKDADIETLPW